MITIRRDKRGGRIMQDNLDILDSYRAAEYHELNPGNTILSKKKQTAEHMALDGGIEKWLV
jgi:hypothetical protein